MKIELDSLVYYIKVKVLLSEIKKKDNQFLINFLDEYAIFF